MLSAFLDFSRAHQSIGNVRDQGENGDTLQHSYWLQKERLDS